MLRLTEKDGIGYLVLDRPPRNEMDLAFFAKITEFRKEVLPSLQVQGLIIHGAGRHFSSGANVPELQAMFDSEEPLIENPEERLEENILNFKAFEDAPFPVVAAIGGCCLGVGLEMALACDFRIAARRAVFSLPEVSFNLMPGCGGVVRLTELLGASRATELILSGRTVLADEAANIGLVDLIVDRKELLKTAETLIRKQAHTQVGKRRVS